MGRDERVAEVEGAGDAFDALDDPGGFGFPGAAVDVFLVFCFAGLGGGDGVEEINRRAVFVADHFQCQTNKRETVSEDVVDVHHDGASVGFACKVDHVDSPARLFGVDFGAVKEVFDKGVEFLVVLNGVGREVVVDGEVGVGLPDPAAFRVEDGDGFEAVELEDRVCEVLGSMFQHIRQHIWRQETPTTHFRSAPSSGQ